MLIRLECAYFNSKVIRDHKIKTAAVLTLPWLEISMVLYKITLTNGIQIRTSNYYSEVLLTTNTKYKLTSHEKIKP